MALHARLPERYPRIRPEIMVNVFVGGRRVLTKATELSLTGCLLERVAFDATESLRVIFPFDTGPVLIHARVVRTRPRADGELDLALAFQDLAWSDVCSIARYLAPRL